MPDMLKKIFLFVAILISVSTGFSQNGPDTLAVDEPTDCETVAYNSANLIMYFYAIRDFDSIGITLNNWEVACGLSEPILRTRILFSILADTFSEQIYDSTMLDYILNYMVRMDTTTNPEIYYDYPAFFGFVPIRDEFDYFTQTVADELLTYAFYHPMELLFSEFYANILTDPLKELQLNAEYDSTNLYTYYYHEVNKYRNKAEFHFAAISGIWIPQGNAALLGNHPLLGIQGGIRHNKMMYDLTLALKFVHSKNEYFYMKDGITDSTDYFLGGYIGLDLERVLLKMKRSEFSVLAGVGYDGFETMKINTEDDNPDNDEGHSVNSINTNFGLGYRYYLKSNLYLALQGKYNILNYYNQGGTNMSGDCITISFLVGGFEYQGKAYRLKELRYIE
jgi:hypothetical protein